MVYELSPNEWTITVNKIIALENDQEVLKNELNAALTSVRSINAKLNAFQDELDAQTEWLTLLDKGVKKNRQNLTKEEKASIWDIIKSKMR